MKPDIDEQMTIRLPADLAGQLEKLMEATGRTRDAITVAALRDYMEAEATQIEDIKQAIAEADRGEFAADSEVDSFFAKYEG